MPALLRILAVSGSTRKSSSNLNLIRAIISLTKETFDITIFEGLDQIPHFNPDLLADPWPEKVLELQEAMAAADGLLICTPEYAAGVPGTLKNAVDWLVATTAFSGKPLALITAATSGRLAHQSLLGTLLLIESRITEKMQLVIPAVKTKVSADDRITDAATLAEVEGLIVALAACIRHPEDQQYLAAPKIGG